MNKTKATIIIAIILVAGGIGLIYQAKKNQSKPILNISTDTSPSPVPQPTPPPTSKNQSQGLVAVRPDPVLGGFLTDSDGITLYYNLKDKNGVSSCTGDCAKNWPPFLNSSGTDLHSLND